MCSKLVICTFKLIWCLTCYPINLTLSLLCTAYSDDNVLNKYSTESGHGNVLLCLIVNSQKKHIFAVIAMKTVLTQSRTVAELKPQKTN